MTSSRRLGTVALLVALLVAMLVTACAGGTPGATTSSEPTGLPSAQVEQIRAYLDGLAQAGRLSGAVSVSADGRTYAAAYGTADSATKAQNTVDTKFRIGSVSKQLTAAVVLLLQERGRLQLTDRLCDVLPGCPAAWTPITLDQLLTHTSGIADHLIRTRASRRRSPSHRRGTSTDCARYRCTSRRARG